jgi:CRISPR system Cascade subunit CasB
MAEKTKKQSKAEAFVEMVIKRLSEKDSAFGAALRKADNPATEYQSWEYLSKWCNIETGSERKAFALTGAALAWAKPKTDGRLSIGQAIAWCYTDEGKYNGNEKDAAKTKLRRLLACTSVDEACDILHPLLNLIRSRGVPLHYAGLLRDLLHDDEYFNERIKPRWARDFYRQKEEEE